MTIIAWPWPNSDTLNSDACGGSDDMTHHLAGFRYDSDSGERHAICTCGWRFTSSDPDEAATRWEQHALSQNEEQTDGPSED